MLTSGENCNFRPTALSLYVGAGIVWGVIFIAVMRIVVPHFFLQ